MDDPDTTKAPCPCPFSACVAGMVGDEPCECCASAALHDHGWGEFFAAGNIYGSHDTLDHCECGAVRHTYRHNGAVAVGYPRVLFDRTMIMGKTVVNFVDGVPPGKGDRIVVANPDEPDLAGREGVVVDHAGGLYLVRLDTLLVPKWLRPAEMLLRKRWKGTIMTNEKDDRDERIEALTKIADDLRALLEHERAENARFRAKVHEVLTFPADEPT